jgi:hypothetical protein
MSSVEDYIASQPADSQYRLRTLRKLILDAAPHIEESIKYGIPFYTYFGLLCYLNPKKDCVDFGFCRGIELSDEGGLLYGDNKEIRKVRIEELNPSLIGSLRQMVQEALLLNEWHHQQKGNKNKKRKVGSEE